MSDPSNRAADPPQFPIWRVSPASVDPDAEIDLPLPAWQIVEVDGEAVPVIEDGEPTSPPPLLRIGDHADEIIVASVSARQLSVAAGEPLFVTVAIVNNGPNWANFQVRLEGWIDGRWGAETQELILDAGQRGIASLQVTPPRASDVEAGDYHLAVVVTSEHYPHRKSRVGLMLTLLPFDALRLELGRTTTKVLSWSRRTALLPLALGNDGNRPVTVRLQGSSMGHEVDFDFVTPEQLAGTGLVMLRPGQQLTTPVRVTAYHLPWFGLRGHDCGIQVRATVAEAPQWTPRVRTQFTLQPLFGPWQLASAAGLVLLGMFGVLFVVLATALMLLRSQSPAIPAPAAQAAPSIIVVQLSQPAATSSAPGGDAVSRSAAPAAGAPGGVAVAPDPALPLVLPDQVTAPGSGGPERRMPLLPAAAAPASALTPATTAGGAPTYAQMFQEVGQRYDLDWRMLAALAYVESGFDTLALSDAGAMGLMQVLPGTWGEWAPAAGASDPFDSYSNVAVAAVYLDYLRSLLAQKGYTGPEWMLVAYNWGIDRLSDFLAAGGRWETLPDARRQYATEVLRIAKTIP